MPRVGHDTPTSITVANIHLELRRAIDKIQEVLYNKECLFLASISSLPVEIVNWEVWNDMEVLRLHVNVSSTERREELVGTSHLSCRTQLEP